MDTPSITFAEATPQDSKHVQSAAKIWAQAAAQRDHKPLPFDGSQALAGVERRWALPGARLVVASKDGVPAGFTLCSPQDGYLEIYYVAVAPDFWGQGVARELLAEVDHFAQKAGFHDLRLWAIADNSRAINLYRANGYRPTGEELTDEASGRVEILLSKEIF
ncbi:GNAT family N-acetyltransferase [Glutamicibacter mishrai]|uniref:GNAT family N-acetyltransferase n=1 Tax=Glutamicibacter mishrai TaxID=1775880 RepID=UPI0020CEEC3F|nr:GNAT family N-acetyltransferase [Glutamicibacter mishrai]UTT40941.1 GNAT family N-acetyltransferase [Glutamicibacter mishrai]